MSLGRRIGFTLGALIVYRFGTYIPLPGIDFVSWDQIFHRQAGGILGTFNSFSGGGIHRIAIFALSIIPYLNAAIIIQLLAIVSPTLKPLKDQGEVGREILDRYTRYLTVFLTLFAAYGVAVGLEGVPGIVSNPGFFFRLQTVISLTGGTMFLVWLSDRITARGIGNGLALIIAGGIIAELPAAVAGTLELNRQRTISGDAILGAYAIEAAIVALVVFAESARRNIAVHFPGRHGGASIAASIPLKLNSSGVVIPAMLAGWALGLLTLILGSLTSLTLPHGRPLFVIVYGTLIIGFALFYAAIVLDPDRASALLQTCGGVVPGVEPGTKTAAYLDFVGSRITLVGGLYLALVLVVPEILIVYYPVPFYLGGSALLIVVCTVMDIGHQFRQARLQGEDYRQ